MTFFADYLRYQPSIEDFKNHKKGDVMFKIAKLSLFIFTLFFSQVTQLSADEIEVVLHDQQIKQLLAQNGLNFDMHCEMKAADSHDKKTSLITLITVIFETKIFNPNASLFPESEEDLVAILRDELKIPELTEHESNQTNQELFNSLLQDSNIHSETIKSEPHYQSLTPINEELLSFDDLYKAIGNAICSYLCQVDQSSAHLYIKIILDTETNTATVQAAPNQNQDGFTRTYEKETIENLFARAEGKGAYKLGHKLQEPQRSAFSCFSYVAIPVVVAAISLAAYATCDESSDPQ